MNLKQRQMFALAFRKIWHLFNQNTFEPRQFNLQLSNDYNKAFKKDKKPSKEIYRRRDAGKFQCVNSSN